MHTSEASTFCEPPKVTQRRSSRKGIWPRGRESGRRTGLYVETSSAVAVARDIARSTSGLTVAIGTSTGLEDPVLPGTAPAELAVLAPDIDRLRAWVARTRADGG